MTAKERFLKAFKREKTDRLPVTTHHVMTSFLNKYMNGISTPEFFDYFGLDPINWFLPQKANEEKGEYFEGEYINSSTWKVKYYDIPDNEYKTQRFEIITPKKTLTMVLQSNEHTTWIAEHLIKEKNEIDILAEYMPWPTYDVEKINEEYERYGDKGLLRAHILGFNIYGQPGCWQDLACFYGIEKLIMETYDDPEWVHTFLKMILEKKMICVESLKGAKYDILELGGGDASSTVISPKLLEEFVLPYDKVIIEKAHEYGQRIVYHTCGGMMPILEDILSMNPDAMETLTPPGMGGDVILSEVKRRIGDKVCLIGGFDQGYGFMCDPEETRKMVRKNFEDAGENGGYILCPSDHFFDAKLECIAAFADEAKKCVYN